MKIPIPVSIIIIIISLSASGLQAQYDDDYTKPDKSSDPSLPEKGDNLIVILASADPQTNFTEFGKHLSIYGFTFKTKDPDYFILVTDPKRTKEGLHYDYALNITFKNDLIIIRVKQSGMSMGAAFLGDVEIIWAEWKYATASGNVMHQSFEDFYPVLKAYGYPVTFSKE